MNAPMLRPFLSLECGIFLASLGFGIWAGALAILTGCAIYILLMSVKHNPVKAFRFYKFHHLWILWWFIGIGVINGDINRPSCPNEEEIKNAIFSEGKVLDIRNSTSGDILLLEIHSVYNEDGNRKDFTNFKIECFSDAVSVSEGEIIAFPSKEFKRIKDPANTFHTGYADRKATQGIFYYTEVRGNEMKVIGTDALYLTALSKRMRDRFVLFIELLPLKRASKNFIITLL
ncbi:MAG: hypothetical protein K2G23_05645, partial [Muribaculaceae bacterium]|nr:hypothetical protein [Muribaculaceae bacterium]